MIGAKQNYLTAEAIDVAEWHRQTVSARDGASVEFVGIVRGEDGDHRVVAIEYEAHGPMAERIIERLIAEARQRWMLHHVLVQHRLGRVAAGEASVAIMVQAPHRAEAFAACQFLIDAIKRDAPIWKREIIADGPRARSGSGYRADTLRA